MYTTPTVRASAIALSILLVGCSSLDRVNQTRKQADDDHTNVKRQFTQIASGSPVQELSTQWINPLPLNSAKPTRAPLPGCVVTFTRPGEVTLAEVSAFITRTCRIVVVVTPDAQFSPGQGKTEKMQGALPAPDASGMVPLDTMGNGDAPKVASNRRNSLHGVYWQGALSGLLDDVTTRLGLSWRYEQGRVSIFYLDTRTFPVMFLDSKTAFSSKVVSGTTTSSGASGSSGGLSGDVNTSQITTRPLRKLSFI